MRTTAFCRSFASVISGQLAELGVDQRGKGALLVTDDRRGNVGREVLERALCLVERACLDVPEGGDVLVHQRLPMCRGIVRRDEAGVMEVRQC